MSNTGQTSLESSATDYFDSREVADSISGGTRFCWNLVVANLARLHRPTHEPKARKCVGLSVRFTLTCVDRYQSSMGVLPDIQLHSTSVMNHV